MRRAGTVFGGGRRSLLLRRDDHRLSGSIIVVALLLLVGHRERRVLLLGDAHVVARVALLHDVSRPRVQQDGVLVELGQFCGTHSYQRDSVSKEQIASFRFLKITRSTNSYDSNGIGVSEVGWQQFVLVEGGLRWGSAVAGVVGKKSKFTYFLCEWKLAYVKLLPSYSPKKRLSPRTMW